MCGSYHRVHRRDLRQLQGAPQAGLEDSRRYQATCHRRQFPTTSLWHSCGLLRRWLDERKLAVELEVDGGVAAGTIGCVARAGANLFVAGSAIFGKPDYAASIAELRKEAVG